MPTLGALTTFAATSVNSLGVTLYAQSAGVNVGATADALNIAVQVKPTAVGGTANGYVDYWLVQSDTATSRWAASANGTDSAYGPTGTARQVENGRFIGRLSVNATTSSQHPGKWEVHGPFQEWVAVVVYNGLGTIISATAADNYVKYQTVKY